MEALDRIKRLRHDGNSYIVGAQLAEAVDTLLGLDPQAVVKGLLEEACIGHFDAGVFEDNRERAEQAEQERDSARRGIAAGQEIIVAITKQRDAARDALREERARIDSAYDLVSHQPSCPQPGGSRPCDCGAREWMDWYEARERERRAQADAGRGAE